MKISGNKRGMVLLFAIFMMVILLGISSAMVMRAVSVGKAGIHKDSGARAFYEAEAGLSYAYAEESGKNFSWYTHEDKDTPIITSHEVTLGSITVSFQPPAPPFVTASAGIDALTGCYNVAGRNFLVKTYPEQVINPDTGQPEYTGVTIVHSQATINGISRTLEYRLGRASVYQYFFFYPGNTNFSGGTYNGRNYGGIHVNGDINLTGSTNLYFLTSLTCGSQAAGRGFIRVPQRDTYLDLAATPDGETPVPIPAAPGVPGQLPCQFHDGINYFFYNPITTFRSGPVGSYTTTVLPAYLDNTLYPGAAWNYPKYRGTSTTPLHYRINDTDLRNFATYEVDNNWNAANPNLNLLETSKSIEVSGIGTATELSMFNTLRSSGTAEQWAQFWNAWRSNHSNDYQAERSAGIFTGGQDWERRLFVAWQNYYLLNGIPQRTYSINREWWNDLRYGEDRTTVDYRAPAEAINVATGQGINAYYINTEQQGSAWQTYLAANRFNVAGENRTLIQDRSQGASHVDTGDLMGSTPDQNVVRQKALAGGIYIGLDDAGDFQNPIAECTSEKQFYNAAYPASDGSVYTGYYQYKPSSVLKIDVACLKARIDFDKAHDGALKDFNGVIFADLNGYTWSSPHYDSNADGIELFNGARLPDGGLSLGTPNNVFIKGDYNLDPDGVPEKNRTADAAAVLARYSGVDLSWQPAEVVSQRRVYTLSNDFPEPSYMPMNGGYRYQYYDEERWVAGLQDFVNQPYYPTNFGSNTWVPAASTTGTTPAATARLTNWFTYYNGGSVPVPANWTQAWVDANWPAGTRFSLDTNGDGNTDTYVAANDLRTDAQGQVSAGYTAAFSYAAVHGAYGSLNPDTPSLTNRVTQSHVYNTAIITPTGTTPAVLESWRSTRTVNGAFIQLPEGALGLPAAAAYGRVTSPSNIFNYESRFGRSANEDDLPRAGLTFFADSSWRDIANADF